jgi:hypothetical protein
VIHRQISEARRASPGLSFAPEPFPG